MVNRADVHCRPPPLHFQRSIPIPWSVHVDPREIARVPLRFHFAPAKPPRLLLPLSASNPFSNFSNGTRVCGKDFLLFLQTHFKHTFSRYQKSRNRTKKQNDSNTQCPCKWKLFLYFSKENSDTIIRNISIVIV